MQHQLESRHFTGKNSIKLSLYEHKRLSGHKQIQISVAEQQILLASNKDKHNKHKKAQLSLTNPL